MHRDMKIGLALGILVLGIVGALFFRNDSNPLPETPQLDQPEVLDEEIADGAVTPYPEPSAKQIPDADAQSSDLWQIPDFLARRPLSAEELEQFPAAAGPPAPISTRPAEAPIPVPQHNQAWEVVRDAPGPGDSRPVSRRNESGGVRYRVQKGDTLSDLALRYLGSSARFMEIYEANRDVLHSPNDLREGVELRIPSRSPTANAEAPASPAKTGAERGTETIPISRQSPPEPDSAATAEPEPQPPVRRFVPVRRSPFVPGPADSRHSGPPRELTQTQP